MLYQLVHLIRQCNAYRLCDEQRLTLNTKRPIFRAQQISRGQYPIVELLFQSWQQKPNFGYTQTVLVILKELYESYSSSNGRVIFRESHLKFLSELRQTFAPVNQNLNRDFLAHLLRNLNQPFANHRLFKDKLEVELRVSSATAIVPSDNQTNYAKKIQQIFLKFFSSSAKPALFFGPDTPSDARPKETTKYEITESDSKAVRQLKNYSNRDPDAVKTEQGTSQNNATPQQHIAPELTQDSIGQVLLDLNHSTYFPTNPHLPRKVKPKDAYEILEAGNTNPITHDQLADFLIWIGFQIGADLRGALSVKVHHLVEPEFGLTGDLSAIWRRRPTLQHVGKTTFKHQSLLKHEIVERRLLPSRLSDYLKTHWDAHNHVRLLDLAIEKQFDSKVVDLVKEHFGFESQAWLQSSRRLMLLERGDSEPAAMLLQKNARSELHSKCAYYSVVKDGINLAGSPYAFDLEKFKLDVEAIAQHLQETINSKSLCESWNAYVTQLMFKIYLTTGGRPVRDAFCDLNLFTDDFDLMIVNDKDIFMREPRRVAPLCKTLADEIKINYRNALEILAAKIKGTTPELSTYIKALLIRPSHSSDQRIPFFFFLTTNGIEGIPPDVTLLKSFESLQANFLRHFVSNHSKITDRDIVEGLLGHENDKIPVYGPSSLRVMKKDHQQIRQFAEEILKFLNLSDSIHIDFVSKDNDVLKQSVPKHFGLKLRRAEYNELEKSLRARAHSDAQSISNHLSSQEITPAQVAKVARDAQLELSNTKYFHIYFEKLTSFLRKMAPDLDLRLFARSGRRISERIPIDFCQKYSRYRASHLGVMGLLQSNLQAKRKINLEFLFALSLIKLNGVTCKIAIDEVLRGNYLIGSVGNSVFIDIRFTDTAPDTADLVRRHQLHWLSIHYHERLANQLSLSQKSNNLETLGRDLQATIRSLGISESLLNSKQDLLYYFAEIEGSFQLYESPGCLAAIASGETKHRSPNFKSFQRIIDPDSSYISAAEHQSQPVSSVPFSTELAKVDVPAAEDETPTADDAPASEDAQQTSNQTNSETTVTDSIKEKSTSKNSLESSTQTPPIKSVFNHVQAIMEHAGRSISDLSAEIKIEASLSKSALLAYANDIETRKPSRRGGLAKSTKLNYYGRIANLFKETDLQREIDSEELEEVIDTINGYLIDRQQILQSAQDDLRQIRDFFSNLATLKPSMAVKFDSLDSIYSPSTDLFSHQEMDLIFDYLRNNKSDDLQAIFILLRRFGLRKNESFFTKPSSLHLLDTTPLVRVVGDSIFRPKFPASNRYVFSQNEITRDEKEILQRTKFRSIKSRSSYLGNLFQSTTRQVALDLNCIIKNIASRGSIHTLRHNFADALTNALFQTAINDPSEGQMNGGALASTTPQGITRKTLFVAGRVLGHAGTITLLETYSHGGFGAIDSLYRNRTVDGKDSPAAAQHAWIPHTLASRYRLETQKPHPTESLKTRSFIAKDYILQSLDYLGRPNDLSDYNSSSKRSLSRRLSGLGTVFKSFPPSLQPACFAHDKTAHIFLSRSFYERLAKHLPDQADVENLIRQIQGSASSNARIATLQRIPLRLHSSFDPLGNFTQDANFVIRESMKEKDLLYLVHIVALLRFLELDPKDLFFWSNSTAKECDVCNLLGDLKLNRRLIPSGGPLRQTAKFNIEMETIWVVGVIRQKKDAPYSNTELFWIGLIVHLLAGAY
ncbi:MAG TPA: hypothetical protein VGE55_14055 [Limnobacter sp.]|uniref:hypothetical protein n=1 Tax=Limnobacter sp. TaxID=2003368 RepID=UPI002ED9A63C